MSELYELPQNQMRKVFALKGCICRLEELQRRYMPTFDGDAVINSLLEQMRTECETMMVVLRDRDDALELLAALEE